MSDPADPGPPRPPIPQPWAAPAAPPFGVPPGHGAPAAPASPSPAGPPYAAATPAPRYAPPPGYAAPYAPAGVAPAGTAAATAARRPSGGSGLGLVAFIAAIVAAVVPTILVSIAVFNVGLGAGHGLVGRALNEAFDWSILTPVRGWVLLAEISFWVGTALGVWAIVQGLIAIVTKRGRGLAIAAVAVAVVGAILYAIALQGFLTAGLAAGTGLGG